MKKVLGAIVILGGIAFGLYMGVWVFFIGGILDLVDFGKGGFESNSLLAWGVIKILFAGLAGGVCGLLVSFIGLVISGDLKD